MRLSSGSQVLLFIGGHGPVKNDNRARARQLLTPEDPNLGTPPLGNCVDEPSDPAAGAIALFTIP
jgi:hypothetical protein